VNDAESQKVQRAFFLKENDDDARSVRWLTLNAALSAAAEASGQSGKVWLTCLRTRERIGEGSWHFEPDAGFRFKVLVGTASPEARVELFTQNSEPLFWADVGAVGPEDQVSNIITLTAS
jgi:hypothetical protein